MKQLTVRGFDPELTRKLRTLARKERISLNQAVLRLLRKGAGVAGRGREGEADVDTVGSSLDDLIGTWTEDEFEEFAEAVSHFETVEPSMWP